VLGRLGGWSLQNSLNNAYAIGVHPGVAVAAAGFHGMKAYNPVQAVAIPPDAVVKLMFGTVMQVHDPDTGTTQDLDIDEAIEASERFFCSPAGKGKQSATPMLKALRVLATALAQVLSSPLSVGSAQISHYLDPCVCVAVLARDSVALAWPLDIPQASAILQGHFSS